MLIFLLLDFVFAIQFSLTIPQKELRCFGETIGMNILVVGSVSAEVPEYSFKIHLPNKKGDNILHYSNSQNLTKFSFTTNFTSQNYQFCIHNLANQKVFFNYSFAIGTEANDFSLLAQKEDLKPIEIQLKKLNNIADSVEVICPLFQSDYKNLEQKQVDRMSFVHKISYKIIVFSGVTLALMISTNVFQLWKVKKFFKQKKMI